jgi:signal transduction histidine kinase
VKTGSLRARVIVTTLALLAVVLAAVVAATTLAYRAKLEGDLRSRLDRAGAAVDRAGSGDVAKQLVQGLALEGIATRITPAAPELPPGKGGPATAPVKPGARIHAQGSLLVLTQVLPDGTEVVFSESRSSIDHAVASLLLVEVLVALGAFAVATLLVVRGTRTALRPLSQVIETASSIAGGDLKLRLGAHRGDTELGQLATAFDQMVEALETAIEEARSSDAATRRFLADASHELRTPIAALRGSAETLLREQPERPERDRLEADVVRDAERLGRLVDDLLGLARLEAHPSRTRVELAPIARALVEHARRRAPRAKLGLTVDDDVAVRGDADALERLLRNVIDNALAAIRPTGRIDVGLRRADGYVEATVLDNGPGIPADARERIFDRFVRLDPGKPGHGLGLAIARRIARQHGGDLTCDPAPAGAQFTLRLPAAPAAPVRSGERLLDPAGSGQAGRGRTSPVS